MLVPVLSEMSISELLEEILVLLRHVSPVGQPQGGRLPVGSSGVFVVDHDVVQSAWAFTVH